MQYLLTREVMAILKISRPTVRRLIDSGELTAIKGDAPNSRLKIDEESVRNYIKRHKVEASA